MEPELELPITLPQRDSRQLLRALHQQLRAAILDGRLQPGLRMPSTRTLAASHGVSRNTAIATYDLLLAEGYLQTRPRGGTYVAEVPAALPASAPQASAAERLAPFWRVPPPTEVNVAVAPVLPYDFRVGLPEQGEVRFDIWQRLAGRALRALARQPSLYSAAEGQGALREAIAGHVSFTRAVACQAQDLVVTAGIQQALDLLARILVTPGQTVLAIEDPGYPPVRAAFGAAGAVVVGVPVDEEGIVVERIPPTARIIYVTPSHQFPLGSVLSMRRRRALLAFAEQHNAVIIEDDYDGEFRFGQRPLDALQTLDRAQSVFYLGTFSKSLFPALRLGFVVTPPWAREALLAAKRCADWHCPELSQDTLAAFISEGHLARHVRKMRQTYEGRRVALLDGLRRHCGHALTVIDSSAGLHLTAYTRPGIDLDALLARAAARGIGLYLLAPYYADGDGRPGLVFGYGAIDCAAIEQGVARLAPLF